MSGQNVAFLAFNRGLVSRLGLARADLKRMALSAAQMVNWMPRVLGSMMLRPGLGYIGATYTNAAARFLPFVFSISDKALIELTASILRVWISDALITRPAVASVIVGGTFPSAASLAANWTDDDEVGGVSAWISAGLVGFTGNGTAAAIRTQAIAVAVADRGVEHALRVEVARGPIVLMVGSTAGAGDYIAETTLDTGTHSLAFTPTTANAYVRFQSRLARIVEISACSIEGAGVMTLPTPWAAADLGLIRHDQSGDIVFVGCGKTTNNIGYQQRKIERRATRSWSVVLYRSDNGPFRDANTGPGTMSPSVLSGNGTLTSSVPFFQTGHVGALFAVTSDGQAVTKSITAQNVFSDPIEITGVGTDRAFLVQASGVSGSGSTVTLQRSIGAPGAWADIANYVVDTTTNVQDALDNQIVYYRIGVKAGGYGAGTQVVILTYAVGNIRGIARVTAFTSTLVVDIEVLTSFGAAAVATDNWEEGQWSDIRGWPTSDAFYEGRLWWAGRDSMVGSASDDFTDMDALAEGDAASINRSIGSGPVDNINWLLPVLRLIAGGVGAEFSARSTTFDEPLTPTNFNLKRASTQGSANVSPAMIDDVGIYVQRGGTRVYALSFNGEKSDYASEQLSLLVPEIGKPGITRVAVQRQPDTRVHFVRSDGTVAVLVFDKTEEVKCWLEVEAGGTAASIEDVVVLPGSSGTDEDQVYYVVARTVNAATVRYLERWALEDDCIGGTVSKIADSYVTFNQASSTTIGGLSHLIGQSVVVWQDGICPEDADGDPKTFVVSGAGEIVVDTAAVTGAAGLPYEAQWQSAKLVQLQAMLGTPLNQMKMLAGLGIIAADMHPKGLKVGRDFTSMDDLPSVEEGAPVDTNVVHTDYDGELFTLPGYWSTDERLCLLAQAPRPVTLLCATVDARMNE